VGAGKRRNRPHRASTRSYRCGASTDGLASESLTEHIVAVHDQRLAEALALGYDDSRRDQFMDGVLAEVPDERIEAPAAAASDERNRLKAAALPPAPRKQAPKQRYPPPSTAAPHHAANETLPLLEHLGTERLERLVKLGGGGAPVPPKHHDVLMGFHPLIGLG
jgi:hypothetical protein